MLKTRPFSELRQERLLIPEVAAEYLNIAKSQSQEVFLKALRRVAQARQISKVAKEAGVQRETLYRALSEAGNPTIETFAAVLSVLGLDFIVSPKKQLAYLGSQGPIPREFQVRDEQAAVRESKRKEVNIGLYKALAGTMTPRNDNTEGQDYAGNDDFASENASYAGVGCADERGKDPNFGLRPTASGVF